MWNVAGLTADDQGNIYGVTGNSINSQANDGGDSVLRFSNGSLTFSNSDTDYFTPSNYADLHTADLDLGSVPALPLPTQTGSSTPDLLFFAGKQGVGYLVDRANLGGVGTGDGVNGEGIFSDQVYDGQIINAPAFFQSAQGTMIYLSGFGTQQGSCTGQNGTTALKLSTDGNGATRFDVMWCVDHGGGSPAVSSNGADGGVLWVIDPGAGLYAYDATSGNMLYGDNGLPGTKYYVTPTVIDGAVYIPTQTSVAKYAPH
jgi:hypothetical protein